MSTQYFQSEPAGIITPWVSYTPTGAWVSNTTYTGRWRRVGDTIEVDGCAVCTGAPTSANFTFGLPSGLVIDTSKMTDVGGDQKALGVASCIDNGLAGYNGLVSYNSTTTVRVTLNQENGSITTNTPVTAVSPFSFNTSDQVMLKFSVPIVGW